MSKEYGCPVRASAAARPRVGEHRGVLRRARVDVEVARDHDLFGRRDVLGVQEGVDRLELAARICAASPASQPGVGRLGVRAHDMHLGAVHIQHRIDEALVGPPVGAAGVLVDVLLLADDRPLAEDRDPAVLRAWSPSTRRRSRPSRSCSGPSPGSGAGTGRRPSAFSASDEELSNASWSTTTSLPWKNEARDRRGPVVLAPVGVERLAEEEDVVGEHLQGGVGGRAGRRQRPWARPRRGPRRARRTGLRRGCGGARSAAQRSPMWWGGRPATHIKQLRLLPGNTRSPLSFRSRTIGQHWCRVLRPVPAGDGRRPARPHEGYRTAK